MAMSWLLTALALPAWGDELSTPPALAKPLAQIVESGLAPGAAALVLRDGEVLYRTQIGDIDLGLPVPVASASKWVATAVVMSLVDEGRLHLDQPIGLRMPTTNPAAGAITLRQILSFTSGQGSLKSHVDLSQPADITLSQSAQDILSMPLDDPPGQVFRYGSGAFQVAGALAEQVTGQSWHELFDERLARPLGMTSSRWVHPFHSRADAHVSNPNLQAGLVTTMADYARFLTMMANGGVIDGRRVLSLDAVEAMETLQTSEAEMAFVPPGVQTTIAGYALGNWCEQVNQVGRCLLVSSPGALGFWPWIDRDSGLYGIFIAPSQFALVAGQLSLAREVVRQVAP